MQQDLSIRSDEKHLNPDHHPHGRTNNHYLVSDNLVTSIGQFYLVELQIVPEEGVTIKLV